MSRFDSVTEGATEEDVASLIVNKDAKNTKKAIFYL